MGQETVTTFIWFISIKDHTSRCHSATLSTRHLGIDPSQDGIGAIVGTCLSLGVDVATKSGDSQY